MRGSQSGLEKLPTRLACAFTCRSAARTSGRPQQSSYCPENTHSLPALYNSGNGRPFSRDDRAS
ncbi:MAG: hypothetical protein ACLUVG_22245 [Phocaeicola vulgatus]